MPRYKRTADDAQLDLLVEPELPAEAQEVLTKLRNMWEFASLMQYIFLFGHVVKIDDDFDIEDLETECTKPSPSEKLARIGLQLLKYVSSHRGLTTEIFDEYTRRQYTAKAPHRNPFGDDEEPAKFNEMDIYTRIQILQQLSTWTLGNAERIRGMMPQDEDHLNWRMEPLGWDKEDRSYYVLDDNRLYRRSDEPVPPPTPKPKGKAKPKSKGKSTRSSRSRAARGSKRRKIEDSEDEEVEDTLGLEHDAGDDTVIADGEAVQQDEEPGFGFTSKTWECLAITLDEYQDFMASIFRSRDPNERALRARIEEDVLPIIEKRAEALKQKQQKKLREMENIQKMATAKRSSRLADKAEKDKQDREEKEAEEKRKADLRMAREEQERQRRIEEGHESRRLTREQRVREREAKRILHEEELARLDDEGGREESQGVDSDAGDAKRASERQRKTQREQHKKELEKLAEDEGTWYFDCSVCGKHGENMDDGSHSIACDKCNVWQHSKCHGFSPKQAESDTFTFVCGTCKRKEEDAQKPKIPPLKLSNRPSASPEISKSTPRPPTANSEHSKNRLPDHVTRQLDSLSSSGQAARPSPGPFGQITSDPNLSPYGQTPAGYRYPPVGNFAPQPPQQPWQGSPYPPHGPGPYPGSPPLSNGNHQQQHHYAHHTAVAASGGHPVYYQNQQYPQPPQTNGYANDPAGMFSSRPPYPQNSQHPYTPQQYGHYQQPQQQLQYQNQQPQQPGSSHLMNGFQSPQKAAPKPLSASPPTQQAQTPNRLDQSPQPHLHPPSGQPNDQRSTRSPVKSSPHPPRLASPALNGSAYPPSHLHTPQMQQSGGAPHSVAADGMSGPWPEGSKAIPQKHDQSPAPPSSAQTVGERKIFPPNTPLVPSPSQNNATGADSIPIKKLGAPAADQRPGSFSQQQ